MDEAKRLKAARQCSSVLDLIDKGLLSFLMSGFCHKLQAGVSMIYRDGDELMRLDAVSKESRARPEFYNPLCALYRSDPIQEALCIECDLQRATSCLKNPTTHAGAYTCHLGLTDMCYPVLIQGQPIAVLMAGQSILKRNRQCIDRRLKERTTESNLPRLMEVYSQIIQNALNDDDLERSKLNFRIFVDQIERLLEQLYDLNLRRTEQEYLASVGRSLTSNDSLNDHDWWHKVSLTVEDLRDITGLKSIHILYRERGRFYPAVSNSHVHKRDKSLAIPARIPMQHPPGELVIADPSVRTELLNRSLNIRDWKNLHVYRCNYIWEPDRPAATTAAILLEGHIRGESDRAFVSSFAELVGVRAGVARLLDRTRSERDDFRHHVEDVAHSVRSPLQSVLLTIGMLSPTLSRDELVELLDDIPLMEQSIEYIQQELMEIYGGKREEASDVDLVALCNSLAMAMEQVAREKHCTIQVISQTELLRVAGVKAELSRAFTNLLDNAIKYSWSGEAGCRRPVTMTLTRFGGDHARIALRNYGIGIPSQKIRIIMEKGARAEIIDKKASRTGTGRGLAIAKELVMGYGGWLEIRSWAADDGPREPYHRYLTEVSVFLPLLQDRRRSSGSR